MDLRRAGKALKLERGPLAPSYSEALEGSLDDGGDVVSKRPTPGSKGAKLTKDLQSQGKAINLSLGELKKSFGEMKKQMMKSSLQRIRR